MTPVPPIAATPARSKWPDATVGLAVGIIGIWQSVVWSRALSSIGLVVIVCFAIACALHRLAPGMALVLVWFGCALQVYFGFDVMAVELATALVAFGCARYGS